MKHFGLLTVAFIGVVSVCDSFVIPLKHGRRLENSTTITTLIKSSLMMCHQSCLARERCRSFQLDRRFNLCYLSSSDTSTPGTNLTIAPGLVYSEKKNWTENTLVKECSHCVIGDTCTPTKHNKVCSRTECGEPKLMDNTSEIRGSMRNIDAKVLHVCTNKPNLYNASVCLPSGQWSNLSLTCPGNCGNLPMIRNGLFALHKPGFIGTGATATVQCNTGFVPNPKPNLQIKCLTSGLWESSKITCDPIDCGATPSVANSHCILFVPNNTTYGATARMACNVGYKRDSVIVGCMSDGKWNLTQMICEPVDCGLVPSIEHGGYILDKQPGNTQYGARASLRCDAGYTASNQNGISCPTTGHWDNTETTCDPIYNGH